ncbi:MAG: 2'-5' RNA ligase family protein [Chitinophagaceae bacterium]|nr:2'-5' RNA ligase family protein [Chitinophagaceae bacterium]
MNKNSRQQLTLFVNRNKAQEIERVRRQFNPMQQQLIDSHVTLCREDEIENIHSVLHNLQQLDMPKIAISFGPVTRFENGTGVLLPALGNNEPFHLLRSKVLAGLSTAIRMPAPHITLMHPRNSTCTDELFSIIQTISMPTYLIFDTISLIEQINGGKWQILKNYQLNNNYSL